MSVRFWDETEKDVTGTLETVTFEVVTIHGKKPFRKASIREVILQ